jgi:hypothetical protein
MLRERNKKAGPSRGRLVFPNMQGRCNNNGWRIYALVTTTRGGFYEHGTGADQSF